MKRRILALVLAMLLALSAVSALAKTVEINAKAFPDKTFRAAVAKLCDKNGDGKLSDKELKAVKRLDLYADTLAYDLEIPGVIASLKGIENFANLKYLDITYQNVKTLDVSKNTKLVSLACDWNRNLRSLKLGKQKRLESLWLFRCDRLKKLDIAGCPKLIALLDKYDGQGNFGQFKGGPVLSTSAKVYIGKKLAVKTRKPTSIAFKKSSVTLTRRQLANRSPYDLGICLVMKPAGTMYPVRYSSTNEDLVGVEPAYKKGDSDTFWINPEAKKGSEAVLTATCGGKKATIRIKLK